MEHEGAGHPSGNVDCELDTVPPTVHAAGDVSGSSADAGMDRAEARKGRAARRGREARRLARTASTRLARPYFTRQTAPLEILDEEAVEIIEANADRILAEVGVEVRDYPRAKDLFAEAGCEIVGDRVRFPAGLARSLCSTAPSAFTQHARNPARTCEIGERNTVFAPVYGSPFVHDLDNGRRYGTIEDFRNFVRLTYLSPMLHHSGGTVCEPVDVPVNKRHLDMLYAHITLSDKPFMGSVTAPERAADTIEICKILFGADFIANNTVCTSLVNANSPLVWDGMMLGAADIFAQNSQASILSPFILAGAMSPVGVAGTLAQVLAEFMVGCAFTQLVRPGAPVVFGTFVSTLSMQSGAPTFGTPEGANAILGAAQLARRLNVPFRTGGSLCASKRPDAQAAYESMATLLPTVQAGANFVLHSAGWLEGGLASSYEKFVMDCDQLGAMQKLAAGIDMSAAGQAMDAFQEVAPGGHFLGCAHTQAHFESAFYRTELHDNNSVEQWEADGALEMPARANARWKKMLAEYEPPPIDQGVDEALLEFIALRKKEMPDASY